MPTWMWYHSGVRTMAICLVATVGVTACGSPSDVAPPAPNPGTSSGAPGPVRPAAVARARADLPAGYEVTDITEPVAPVFFWGFKSGWVAQPEHCGELVDPGAGTPVRGWSASGPGGIVYAVVAGPGARAAAPDGCAAWSLTGGHTSATVTPGPAPTIPDAPTVAMSAVATTTVEGGTVTRMHADTVTAYLAGAYIASVTVVTDPGSAQQTLPADTAPHLLAQVVSAVTR
ncbi:DUF5642 family protein [Mycolicibacterium cosmeticum]|uniref:DUF5642 domain-containing protein n=1 Tax=Mycolicibacterium cosmeticum TaxID=258533 RepID=W9AND3_MYCCO|nr:DUF5642 family protein [Mycolicibacterium cosmeticum]CDO06988.1 hypothetical protein BN977_01786 [Mycolicibacterium cosmeticum]